MTKKLPFDTLELATLLKTGGVDNANVHAASLAAVITQNLHTKNEVDKMIEAALAKFDESMRRFDESMRQTHARFDTSLNEFKLAMERDRSRHDKAMLEVRIEFKKDMSRSIYTAFAICGSVITVISTVATLLGHFVH